MSQRWQPTKHVWAAAKATETERMIRLFIFYMIKMIVQLQLTTLNAKTSRENNLLSSVYILEIGWLDAFTVLFGLDLPFGEYLLIEVVDRGLPFDSLGTESEEEAFAFGLGLDLLLVGFLLCLWLVIFLLVGVPFGLFVGAVVFADGILFEYFGDVVHDLRLDPGHNAAPPLDIEELFEGAPLVTGLGLGRGGL
jgi:hypothetical protein